VTAESLSPGIPGSSLYPYSLALRNASGADFQLGPFENAGEAIYVVRRGMIEAVIGGSRARLRAGDAVQAPLALAHRFRSHSEEPADLIAVFTEPMTETLGTGPRDHARESPATELTIEPAAATPGSETSAETEQLAAPLLPSDPTPFELGRRIKLLRVARDLTLRDLEERGGISATHVSEIERGKASPTVGALARIAHALGLRPATLVEPRVLPAISITRADDRRRILWGAASFDLVTEPVESARLGAHLLTLPIGRQPALVHRHEGEEWATVITGSAEIRIEDEVHALNEGDALHFRAHRLHSYANLGSDSAVLLVASRPRLTL